MKLFLMDVSRFQDKSFFDAAFSRVPLWRQEKVLALYHEKDRCLSLGASLAFDYGLNAYAIPSSCRKIALNKYGKPHLSEFPQIQFNLSHSGRLAGALFSDVAVGFDVEEIEYATENEVLENRIFHPQEKLFLQEKPMRLLRARCQFFYALWTLKESYLKALGCGLSLEPNTLFFPLDILRKLGKSHEHWFVFSYEDWTLGSLLLQHENATYALAFCNKAKSKFTPHIIWI